MKRNVLPVLLTSACVCFGQIAPDKCITFEERPLSVAKCHVTVSGSPDPDKVELVVFFNTREDAPRIGYKDVTVQALDLGNADLKIAQDYPDQVLYGVLISRERNIGQYTVTQSSEHPIATVKVTWRGETLTFELSKGKLEKSSEGIKLHFLN